MKIDENDKLKNENPKSYFKKRLKVLDEIFFR